LNEVWWGNTIVAATIALTTIVGGYYCPQFYSKYKNRHERRLRKSLLREYSMNPEISDPDNPYPAKPFEERYPIHLAHVV
jgi:hypothetical protein